MLVRVDRRNLTTGGRTIQWRNCGLMWEGGTFQSTGCSPDVYATTRYTELSTYLAIRYLGTNKFY